MGLRRLRLCNVRVRITYHKFNSESARATLTFRCSGLESFSKLIQALAQTFGLRMYPSRRTVSLFKEFHK